MRDPYLVRCAAIALGVSLAAPALSVAQNTRPLVLHERLRQQLDRRLHAIADGFDGVMGYSVVDLTSGERLDELADGIFPTASTIKLAVLYELYRQVDAGLLRLDDTKPLDRRHVVGGSGVLFELGTPALSIRDYATLMIVLSDNTATNVILDRVGMANVNATLERLGLKSTRLRRRMMDLDAARKGDENVSSPRELARILEILWKGEGLGQSSRDEAIAILRKSKTTPMVRAITPGVEIASKSGDLDGVRADAGVVAARGRPYIFAAMTTYAGNDAEAERAIEDASRVTYQYFSRLGSGGEFGRPIDR